MINLHDQTLKRQRLVRTTGGALLLVADFGTSETTQSIPVAACLAVGYLLLVIWCILTGGEIAAGGLMKES